MYKSFCRIIDRLLISLQQLAIGSCGHLGTASNWLMQPLRHSWRLARAVTVQSLRYSWRLARAVTYSQLAIGSWGYLGTAGYWLVWSLRHSWLLAREVT